MPHLVGGRRCRGEHPGGRLRLAFHLYDVAGDADRAAAALAAHALRD